VNPVEIGVLLPTREAVMSSCFETGLLLALAERIEAAGYDSIWAGDSILARPASCLERLQRFVAVGVRTIVLRFGGGDQAEQLERATRELLPRLKG